MVLDSSVWFWKKPWKVLEFDYEKCANTLTVKL